MANSPQSPELGKCVSRWLFLVGCILPPAILGILAELYLSFFPPKDLHSYLGDSSPLSGIYRSDEDFGATYVSWEQFQEANADRLEPYLPLRHPRDGRPIWAFFGNSFVQAPGMLADQARMHVTDHCIFNLGRNEHLVIRLAQIKLLLEQGLAPERIFVELMPLDLASLGEQPLATLRVSSRGALLYEPRLPSGPLGWLMRHSRAAFTAWCRSGRQRGNPDFRPSRLTERLEEPLLGDLRLLFERLARRAREHQVDVTVVLIPNHEQIQGRAPFGFQDTLTPLLRQQGFDVFDPRQVFCSYADRTALFVPDKHFSTKGNELLLAELLHHVHGVAASSFRMAARKP
jgi:hypothetical protein